MTDQVNANSYLDTDSSNICEVLQILGAKWAFLVLNELLRGPQRFNQLQRNAAVIKTQSLTDTLRHLEQNGLVLREVFPTVPVTVEYSLTEKGSDFQTALKEMNKWVEKWGKPQQVNGKTSISS
ncbi:helix-turn-helix domain-containing protein [Paenibacillus chondroitinus]|uniref:Helix-turn-helix domain-containing protein n=1 Tax=Paenibacillus chondroitinus TaxID=59842 RepID=A0ABU6DF43_9BACL|nr:MULTISPECIES: helix-turn-helix domain-containing protein [Paenibacillus]MCY9659866.1 helix-turn-helix transcriptional regulator [Paenibacillus anseongense]MEB4795516.1 helix-turn-helix domain-containing protein [Paenibacillus chondroitinus]